MKTRSCYIPAAMAWLLSKTLAGTAAVMLGLHISNPLTWARFDSYNFFDIASHGYHIVYRPIFLNGHWSYWAGNTENWPFYAWLIRLLHSTGLSLPWCGLAITSLFYYGVLCELWKWHFKMQSASRAILLMALAGCFPGGIYNQVISPISLMTFELLLFLRFLTQERWRAAFGLGIVCGMTHTEAIFLPLVILLWLIAERSSINKKNAARLAIIALAPLIGFVVVGLVQRWQTGVWDSAPRVLMFHRYSEGWSMLRLKEMLYIPPLMHPTSITKMAVIAQSSCIALLCIAACWKIKMRSLANQKLMVIFACVYWLVPHFSILRQSYYRAEALLLAAPILLIELPTAILILILILWVPLAYVFANQFFCGVLI